MTIRVLILCLLTSLITSAKARGVPIPETDNNKRIYEITNNEKYLIEIDGKSIKIFDHTKRDLLKEIFVHSETISCHALSFNSKYLATGSTDKSVALLDIEKGTIIKKWNIHVGPVTQLKFTKNTNKLISVSSDKSICIYDTKTFKLIKQLKGHTSAINSISINKDDSYIVSASSDSTAIIWDIKSGKQTGRLQHTGVVLGSQFNPATNEILTFCKNDDSLRLWSLKTFNLTRVYTCENEQPIPNGFYDVKWNESGNRLLACKNELYAELYSFNYTETKPSNTFIGLISHNNNFGFTQNDKLIFCQKDDAVLLIDAETGKIAEKHNTFLCKNDNYIYIKNSNDIINKLSVYDFNLFRVGFFYPLLELRPKLYLLSCAADKYTYSLINCVSDAEKIITYFSKSNQYKHLIDSIKSLFISSPTQSANNYEKLDSLQALMSKEPIVVVEKLHDNVLSKQAIESIFKKWKGQILEGDYFIFHFSGMGAKMNNNGQSTLLFPKDTNTFFASDLLQLSELFNSKNQLFILDAQQNGFVSEFKQGLLNLKSNSQFISRNRIVLALNGTSTDNYKNTGTGAVTYAFINNKSPFAQIFERDFRLKNEYDYNLFNSTGEIAADKQLNFDIFRESDYYDVEFKTNKLSRGITISSDESENTASPNQIKKGETLSVIVGINQYDQQDQLSPLKNCISDADKTASALEKNYGHKIILLKNINHKVLRDTLYYISKNYIFQEGSQFLFYFAGHGGYDKYEDRSCLFFKDSKVAGEGDYENYISASMLEGLINRIMSTKTMVIIDACHSRKLVEECKEAESLTLDEKNFGSITNIEAFLKSPGKVIFTSANVFQEASDGNGFNNSPFTSAFLSSITSRGAKKTGFDSKAVYYDMLQFQAENRSKLNFQSDMKYCSYNKSNKGDDRFIFIPK